MHQVAIVWHDTQICSRVNWQVIGLHTVGGHDDAMIVPVGIRPQPQMHRQLEHAQVGAVAGDDKRVDILVVRIEPGVESGAERRADRVLGNDGKALAKRQGQQLGHGLGLLAAARAVRAKAAEFRRVVAVAVLRKDQVLDARRPGLFEQPDDRRHDAGDAGTGEDPLVRKAHDQVDTEQGRAFGVRDRFCERLGSEVGLPSGQPGQKGCAIQGLCSHLILLN